MKYELADVVLTFLLTKSQCENKMAAIFVNMFYSRDQDKRIKRTKPDQILWLKLVFYAQ